MQHKIVRAFIQSLAHREQVEAGATTPSAGETAEIRYPSAMEWPWPRQFTYTREFFSQASSTECLQVIRSLIATTEEHVINFFSAELDAEVPHFEAAGYVEAWRSRLLGHDLDRRWNQPDVTGTEIHEVASSADMVRYASLPGISNPGLARDASIHNFFATSSGEVLAKGQLVYCSGSVAYVSDMFTKPEHRNKGLCADVLAAIESKALSLGATHTCLAPGQEVEAFGLYEKYGYVAAGVRSVLIPKG
ncbi:GNAT family N-acetyltransferase [Rhodoferax sp. AJA081-3]|uniref:GNAT family N-acetyltransferase n=1 Tax=Rhodoferax sp. AJA081-3 TaxID=2752316 RepID=UPI001ADEC799|nr:GNAT family N-acetyltransferase [Rhodoferax sp. AJA081-3]QTN28603.1 GNAT family N-acetyltransferase [Rhodoferax sp. AJA081-3]